MFFNFVDELRAAGIKASFKEHLMLLEALDKDVIEQTPEQFYYLSRAVFVKDEGLLDKFDQVFNKVFKGILTNYGQNPVDIPEDWLKAVAEKFLTPEEMAAIEKLGSWEEIMETLKKRLEEQQKRHEGGNKWVGTGGTSPFGNSGYNPEGVRVGGESKHKRALKVWEKREFQNLDNTRELGTRNIKVALRRLRKFAREGLEEELALDDTIRATAANAGWLELKMQPERKNKVKVLMLMDVGGTMDDHIGRVEELFSAAKTEFKNMEFFYFHNCVYETLWKNNRRRQMAKKFAGKRARLKAITQDQSVSMEERFAAQLKLAQLPRNSAQNRIRNRCEVTGRPRAFYRKHKLSRIALEHTDPINRVAVISSMSRGDTVQVRVAETSDRWLPYDVPEARPYRIHQRIVAGYRRGRLLLAGDAAHLNSPSGGMGMNGGMHDAFNLADKLAKVLHGEAGEDLYGCFLKDYEKSKW